MKDGSPDDIPRVLFLHGIDTGPTGSKQRLVQRAVGRSKFFAPDLKTRRLLFWYTVLFGALLIVLVVTTVVCWVFASAVVAFFVSLLAVLIGVAGYVFGGRGLSVLLLRSSVRIATEAFHNFRPQIIVASAFGAVVAFNMDIPKLPLLLFTPAQDMYRRYLRTTDPISLRHYPYTLIVHGSRDTVVLLEDSIRLVETSELGRCRLEVIDDDHNLRSLTQEEVSGWVEEVYKRGRTNVLALAEEGDKGVDPSLYEPSGVLSPEVPPEEEYAKAESVDEDKTSPGTTGSYSPSAGPDYAPSTSVEDSDFYLP